MITVTIYEGNPSYPRLIESHKRFRSWGAASAFCAHVAPRVYGRGDYWFVINK